MKYSDEAIIHAYETHPTKAAAAEALGMPRTTFGDRLREALKRRDADPAISEAMQAIGTDMTPSMVWIKTKDYSVCLKPPRDTQSFDLREAVIGAVEDAMSGVERNFVARPESPGDTKENLLVIDAADVHFGKLCVATETGYAYNRDAAASRVMGGIKALLDRAKKFGIHRILFLLGNDILHVDNAKDTTTSGTLQDTDGTIFQMYRDAFVAFSEAIEECAAVADVDLVHIPSNHDWVLGWALSQQLGAWFQNHPNVNATPYNLSEMHRKYYRYGTNLIGLSHGDGAKESSLYACMVAEAREHISDCKHLYWYLHHVHHKVRKRTGLKTELLEKDHVGLTVVSSAEQNTEGQQIEIEYVRSPSPPDSWHHRNGYVNRQAVECFIHHPHDGQIARFTEWF